LRGLPTLPWVSLRLFLGPQVRSATLRETLDAAGFPHAGRIVAITAGWQEREGELTALERHLETSVVDLRLYARADQAFADDPGLYEAYRARQGRLKTAQELYRLRLGHAVTAARELLDRRGDDAQITGARERAVAAVRQLDREHRSELANVHAEFEAEWQPSRRPAVAHHMSAIAELIAASELVLIAGGHVAVLLNRLRLFGLGGLLHDKPVAAWSAGAMSLAGSVLLFHDGALHRPGAAELFEAGLELLDGAIMFPYAGSRLALDDHARVRLLAGRCAPASCYTLDEGEWLAWRDGARGPVGRARRLNASGAVEALAS